MQQKEKNITGYLNPKISNGILLAGFIFSSCMSIYFFIMCRGKASLLLQYDQLVSSYLINLIILSIILLVIFLSIAIKKGELRKITQENYDLLVDRFRKLSPKYPKLSGFLFFLLMLWGVPFLLVAGTPEGVTQNYFYVLLATYPFYYGFMIYLCFLGLVFSVFSSR